MRVMIWKRSTLLMLLAAVCILGGILAVRSSDSVGVSSDESGRLLPIYSVDRGDEKLCAITFDAAWDDADTELLLDVLGRYQARATFFVVGSWVEKYPESVKKLAAAGHEIANHSDTHPHIGQLSDEKIREEITRCDDRIERAVGKRPTLFRGPYGEYNDSVVRIAEETGHRMIQWDVDSLDWKELATDDIVGRVTKRVGPGSIVLFHNGAKNTPAALSRVLEKLAADGYRFVPASELIYWDSDDVDNAGKQLPARERS